MVNFFRLIALLEGVSYILLLFVAVPIKYLLNDPSYVKLLGMPHGLLFVAYVALTFVLQAEQKWPTKTLVFILGAALLPFATFYVDYKYLKPIAK